MLAVISLHVLVGFNKGDLNNGCTSVRGSIVILITATVSDAEVTSNSLGVSGPVVARAELSSDMAGVGKYYTMIYLSLNSTVMGKIRTQTSQAKVRTVPSSVMARVKYWVTWCTSQRTRMCSSCVTMQSRSRG